MTPKLVTPELLRYIFEALVIRYELDEVKRRFTLVADYPPDRNVGREFIRFEFDDVRDFVRIPGSYKPLQRFTAHYSARESTAGTAFELIDWQSESARTSVEVSLGTNFGGVRFTFATASAWTRATRAERNAAGEWHYRDLAGRPLDFYDPIPDEAIGSARVR